MKRAIGGLLFGAFALHAAYSYFYTDTLATIDTARWQQNGSVTATGSGLTATTAGGGSLIYKQAIPDAIPQDYEAKTTLTLAASGGTYTIYMRASLDARLGPTEAGTFYAFEIQNPTFNGSSCTATLAYYK